MRSIQRCLLPGFLAAFGAAETAVGALPLKLVKIVDSSTPIPAQPALHFLFQDEAALDGDTTVFSGGNNSGTSEGVYSHTDSGGIQIIANFNTTFPNPGGCTFTFRNIGGLSADDDEVAFGASASTCSSFGFGLFKGSAGNLSKVTATTSTLPGQSGPPNGYGSLSISNGDVTWQSPSGFDDGIFTDAGGTISALLASGDPMPGSAEVFDLLSQVDSDGGKVVVAGCAQFAAFCGIYLDSGAGFSAVVESGDHPPGRTEVFGQFVRPVLDGGDMAFRADYQDPPGTFAGRGIYSTDGGLHTIADFDTPVPGGSGNFTDFAATTAGGLAMDDQLVAFTGTDGTSAGIYLHTGCTVEKIIATGDLLDGSMVQLLRIDREALDDDSLVFWAALASGIQGIWRADFALPPGGSCAGAFAVANNASGTPLAGRMRPATASGTVRVERVNTTTGAALTNMTFFSAGGMSGRQVISLPNIGGTTAGELAVLATRDSDGQIRAEIRDADSRALLKSMTLLSGAYLPVWLFEVPDLDNDGKVDLGLLALRKSDERTVVKLAGSLSGTAIGSLILYSPDLVPLTAASLPDLDGSGEPEIAVLADNPPIDRYTVQVRNALGAAAPRTYNFAPDFDPLQLAIGPDKDGNGVPELAVLARRRSDDRGQVEMRNAFGAAAMKQLFFATGYTPVALALAGDTDNNTSPEWAALLDRNSNHRPYTQLRNLSGPAGSVRGYLTSAYSGQQILVLPDSDNIGGPDIGVIARRNSDGRLRMEIRNAQGGGTTRAFFFSP